MLLHPASPSGGYPDTPSPPLLFPEDLPVIDKPRPRFARADADVLSRLIIELLARTDIRHGELLALTVDVVV